MAAVDVLARLTPGMREVLEIQADLAARLARPGSDLEVLRANYAAEHRWWNEGGPRMARSTSAVVATPHGPVPVRVHHPEPLPGDPGPAGTVVYLHGGGFVLGDLDSYDRILRELAAAGGAVVVGVAYTLSPEAKVPQAVEEAAAVVRHLAAHPGDLGVPPGPVALAGDSAGASIALATALHLRAADGPRPSALLLWYGLYGLRDSASRRLLGGPWDGLAPEDLAFYTAAYTAGPDDLTGPAVDCLGADPDLLASLPPTYVAATDLDPLLDDSVALAGLLEHHGVPHRLHVLTGVLHGFLHCSRTLPEAREALAAGAAFLRAHRLPAHHPLENREAHRWISD